MAGIPFLGLFVPGETLAEDEPINCTTISGMAIDGKTDSAGRQRYEQGCDWTLPRSLHEDKREITFMGERLTVGEVCGRLAGVVFAVYRLDAGRPRAQHLFLNKWVDMLKEENK